MRKIRVIAGTALSAIMLVTVLPAVYWLAIRGTDALLGLPELPVSRPAALILAGLSWSIAIFWILWAYSYIVFVGAGSPVEAFGVALEPTKYLVTTGPYAYVRNPIVFGMLFIFLGVGLLADSIGGLALVPVAGLIAAAYLRLFEERGLVRRFGVAYEHYREHVPMIIPRREPYVPRERET